MIVVIKHVPSGEFVPAVNPRTRMATADAQQFRRHADGRLDILPRYQWVADPVVVEVGAMRY